ncbi:hypothetical protein K3495_g5792 [Podosphaera aphanis]|nr:hypothetical protein K3495_g5792 [Podosphaera aphanis]
MLLERLGLKNSNGVSTPLVPGTVQKESENDELLDNKNSALYRQIVGSAIYISNGTRPDTSYAVGQLARFMSKPRSSFLSHAKNLLKYLQRIANYRIPYSPSSDSSLRPNLICNAFDIYANAKWGTEDNRKSIQGYAVVYNGGATSWTSQ